MIGWLERWQIPLYLVALGAGAACGSGITEPTPCPRSRAKARRVLDRGGQGDGAVRRGENVRQDDTGSCAGRAGRRHGLRSCSWARFDSQADSSEGMSPVDTWRRRFRTMMRPEAREVAHEADEVVPTRLCARVPQVARGKGCGTDNAEDGVCVPRCVGGKPRVAGAEPGAA